MAMTLQRHLPYVLPKFRKLVTWLIFLNSLFFLALLIVGAVQLGFSADIVHHRNDTGYASSSEKHRLRYTRAAISVSC